LKIRKKILIVGGTGFIGYHLAKRAIKRGWQVTSISSRKPKKIRNLKKVKYLLCDITNLKLLKKCIRSKFKYVVNLGGYVDHSNKKKTFKSHYIGVINLTKIFLRTKPAAFIQMGSSGEYGNLRSPHHENNKCNPKSVYAKAKLLSTKHLVKIYKKDNFPCTILRLYLAYGPKQDTNRFLPVIIKGCIKDKKFPCSHGNQFRDFVYVDDVVNAIIKSLINKKSKGQIINIGTGKPKKIRSIINYVKRITKGGHPQFGRIKLRKDEILKTYPNIKKAKKIIKWIPKISFYKGLKSTINFYDGK